MRQGGLHRRAGAPLRAFAVGGRGDLWETAVRRRREPLRGPLRDDAERAGREAARPRPGAPRPCRPPGQAGRPDERVGQ